MENSNILLAAIATFASKRFDRSLLDVGNHPARFRITGHVGDEKIVEVAKGELIVSPNQSRTNAKKPTLNALVAALLYHTPKAKRRRVCESLAASLESDEACESLADHLIAELTTSSISEIRGTIAFETH